MGQTFCLTKDKADELKKAALAGEINIAKMYEMSSAERRDLFGKYVDPETAQFVNGEFEKAMVSEQQTALKKWAQKTFNVREKKSATYNDVLQKIADLNKRGVLTPKSEDAYLEDLVRSKLGINVSSEESAEISKRSDKLEELSGKIEGLGDPDNNPQGQLDYLKARREMEDYLDSLTPSGNLRVLTSTIARGNMLFRVPSMLVNINSNNIEGAIGHIIRRVSERVVAADNADQVGKYIKFNAKVYRETGFDLSRMVALKSDRKVLGEDVGTSQGKGLIRKIGRWYEDKVFNLTQGLPDVVASSYAFSDRATLMSTRIARHQGLKGAEAKAKALEIVKDAMNVEPKTEEGKLVRESARIDAERSTNTDKRIMADKLLKFRKQLNVKDLRFGDMNIPFVKTTANAIQSGLQTSGITIPVEAIEDTLRMVKMVQGGQGWGESSEEAFRKFGETVTRAGIGMLAAYLISNAIDKDDYVGIYPTNPNEKKLFGLKNAVANSFRIGNHFYSVDWLGPVAAPLVGFLTAKKYANNIPTGVYFYGTGVMYQVLHSPGIDFVRQGLDNLVTVLTSTKTTAPNDVIKQLANYSVDFVKSRFVAGFIQTIAEFTDNVVRDTSSKNDILAPLKSVIPGPYGRQSLPEKKNALGESIPSEGWRALIFGGRSKTVNDNPVVAELDRLINNDQLPTLTDIETGSNRVKELKTQIGEEKYKTAVKYYYANLKSKITKTMNSLTYKRVDDEEKKKRLNSARDDALEEMLFKFHYRKPRK
jgi:hypothetical protein